MSKIDNTEFTEIFVSEAKEHIQNLNNALLELEKNPANEEPLTIIFRAAHTIKGNAATMGFEGIRDLTHKLEDVLDKLRKHELKVTKDIVDTLFECLDIIENMINNLGESSGDIDTSGVIQKLEAILDTSSSPQPQKKEDNTAKKQGIILTGKDIGAIEKLSKKTKAYAVKVKVSDDCQFRAVRAHLVLDNLKAEKIITTSPPIGLLEKGEFDLNFTLIMGTAKKKSIIEQAITHVAEIDKVEITELPKTKDSLQKYTETQKSPETKKELPAQTKKAAAPVVESVQSVRVSMDRLDKLMNLVGELLISKMQLEDIKKRHGLSELDDIVQTIDHLSFDIQNEVMEVRMVPVDHIFARFPRLVRDLAHEQNKKIELMIEGKEIELDRTVLDRMGDPLVHLLRNSIDHGIETPEERKQKGKPDTGAIKLHAKREKNTVSIQVIDDGKGLDPAELKQSALKKGLITQKQADSMNDTEACNLIFLPGFSTNKVITEISGRGVGMDVVKSVLDSLGGQLKMESVLGKGTTLTMSLPLTLAIQQVLLINISGETYAIPVNIISKTIKIKSKDIKKIKDREVIIYRSHELPLIRINRVFSLDAGTEKENLLVMVVEKDEELVGFIIDDIIGEQQIVIKTLGNILKNVKGFAGGTTLGNGKVALILDINTLVEIS